MGSRVIVSRKAAVTPMAPVRPMSPMAPTVANWKLSSPMAVVREV